MVLKSIELSGFKSFGKKSELIFDVPVTAIVGPNGSGKSNVVEAIRFVLGEQSMKSLRGKGGSDLIFKGSKQLSALQRAHVTIVFDNTKRVFTFPDSKDSQTRSMSFDEVRISREVFADGTNRYLINGSEVRLKDIVELLASVHIGASGHHIISQGEADKILSSNSKDRRLMIEDALGLKIYQFRIKESERRLEKTEINMKEVSALKRELAPHLTYLKKQVEKIEKTQTLRIELSDLYKIYGSQEKFFIETRKKDILHKKDVLNLEFQEIDKILKEIELKKNKEHVSVHGPELLEINKELSLVEQSKNELERSLGRLEGAKDALLLPVHHEVKKEKLLPTSFVKDTLTSVKEAMLPLFNQSNFSSLQMVLQNTISMIDKTLVAIEDRSDIAPVALDHSLEINQIDKQISALESDIVDLLKTKEDILIKKRTIEESIKKDEEALRLDERGYYEIMGNRASLESRIRDIHRDFDDIQKREEFFSSELREGVALLGLEMPNVFDTISEGLDITTLETLQTDLRRKIERTKIKLEEGGALGGTETLKEYESTKERDLFLTKELDDLSTSISELRILITDLKIKLDEEFKNGIQKINAVFERFFGLMFGGGTAHLSISVEHKKKKKGDEDVDISELVFSDDEMEFERGIDINVSLPQKKVKELSMLSGGERSLTSIALLFAMSQVNPPPFLVLDETDAALDEANSRRYGDMIQSLSEFSQLIVVTHNRETMSRAHVLYGVTVGMDGASKLLSIKFNDAMQYAK